jgi:hypothetical protein
MPKPLEVLTQQMGPHGLQIVLEQFRHLHGLFCREILAAFEQAPP